MQIDYTVRRSNKRKKLTIVVERDRSIVVLAPEKATDEKIEKIIDSKRQWIYEKISHPQKYSLKPHAPGKELVNGESLYYLGREYQIEITEEDTIKQVIFKNKFFIPKNEDKNISKKLLKKWYIQRAKEKILPRVKQYAKDLGVNVNDIKIVDNRYRWGSCTVNNNINISWRLIKAPIHIIDYIIVHELAHLLEPNHTQVFWNIVRAQLPKADKAKLWLKENGQMLQEEF